MRVCVKIKFRWVQKLILRMLDGKRNKLALLGFYQYISTLLVDFFPPPYFLSFENLYWATFI